MMFNDYSLYLVASSEYAADSTIIDITERALLGGVDIVQLREKFLPQHHLVSLGTEMAELCRKYNKPFIVNDDPYLACLLEADGIHLGQEDLYSFPLGKTRKLCGKKKIIGISTHSLEQFTNALSMDLDYIAYGPVFPTKTKDYHIGTEHVSHITKISSKPVIFIGGINKLNIDHLLDLNVKNVAMIRSIVAAEDPFEESKYFKQLLLSKGGGR